jgi:hypothetical protein
MIGEYALIQADLHFWKYVETRLLHTSVMNPKNAHPVKSRLCILVAVRSPVYSLSSNNRKKGNVHAPRNDDIKGARQSRS